MARKVCNDILNTLREKLKDDEARTIIMPKCLKEMNDIIESEVVCREFAATLHSDIVRYNERRIEYLRTTKLFEAVKLNDGQKKKKKGPAMICSYKFKKRGNNNKNIRCIYITDEEAKWNIFLKCFVEKSNEGKRGDYKVAIDEAIERYNEIYERD